MWRGSNSTRQRARGGACARKRFFLDSFGRIAYTDIRVGTVTQGDIGAFAPPGIRFNSLCIFGKVLDHLSAWQGFLYFCPNTSVEQLNPNAWRKSKLQKLLDTSHKRKSRHASGGSVTVSMGIPAWFKRCPLPIEILLKSDCLPRLSARHHRPAHDQIPLQRIVGCGGLQRHSSLSRC